MFGLSRSSSRWENRSGGALRLLSRTLLTGACDMPNNSIADVLSRTFGEACILPDSGDYDAARTGYLGGFDPKPAAIVRPRDAADVARVVGLARDAGVELSVRGGGHSFAGHGSCDGGIVLDLKEMKSDRHRRALADGVDGDRSDDGGVHQGRGRAWPCRGLRRRRQCRHRRHHARRRRRLPRPDARADHRLAACRRGRHRRRKSGLLRCRLGAGPVLGDPGRRRQLRRRHAAEVPPARTSRLHRRHALPAGDGGEPRPSSSRRPKPRPKRCPRSSTSCRLRPCRSCRRAFAAHW